MRFKGATTIIEKGKEAGTFNSLYEIRNRDKERLQGRLSWLSILFMRFGGLDRFVRARGNNPTFNSLYEILFDVDDYSKRTEAFNSLYEIHGTNPLSIRLNGETFQFSLWDSPLLTRFEGDKLRISFNSLYEIPFEGSWSRSETLCFQFSLWDSLWF